MFAAQAIGATNAWNQKTPANSSMRNRLGCYLNMAWLLVKASVKVLSRRQGGKSTGRQFIKKVLAIKFFLGHNGGDVKKINKSRQ